MKAKELREKTIDELKKLLSETQENVYGLRLERINRKLKNVSQMKKARHTVARVLTIIKEKEEKARTK